MAALITTDGTSGNTATISVGANGTLVITSSTGGAPITVNATWPQIVQILKWLRVNYTGLYLEQLAS